MILISDILSTSFSLSRSDACDADGGGNVGATSLVETWAGEGWEVAADTVVGSGAPCVAASAADGEIVGAGAVVGIGAVVVFGVGAVVVFGIGAAVVVAAAANSHGFFGAARMAADGTPVEILLSIFLKIMCEAHKQTTIGKKPTTFVS